jgi:BMFP domain-containing protein YqiC
MLNNELLNKINESIVNILQQNNIAKDITANIKTMVASVFSKLDLVTRDEYEVQKKLLIEMTSKIEELEKKVKQLQNKTN